MFLRSAVGGEEADWKWARVCRHALWNSLFRAWLHAFSLQSFTLCFYKWAHMWAYVDSKSFRHYEEDVVFLQYFMSFWLCCFLCLIYSMNIPFSNSLFCICVASVGVYRWLDSRDSRCNWQMFMCVELACAFFCMFTQRECVHCFLKCAVFSTGSQF